MTIYEPGTVAVATVRGEEGVRVMRCDDGRWLTATDVGMGIGYRTHFPAHVTDVRPLVVLDVDALAAPYEPNPTNVASVTQLLRCLGSGLAEEIADQIEAQTKPPRIPEPGWGERVLAATKSGERRQFVHAYGFQGGPDGVWTDASGFHAAWSDLVDPVLVRDGIEDGAS